MATTVSQKSQELANSLWGIANDLRGSMGTDKFKNYILGVIFYRYLSEKTESYMDSLLKDDGLTYREALKDEEFAPVVKDWSIEHLGYIMYPENLFASLIDKIKANEFSIEDFERAIKQLVDSTIGQESESAFDKLFDDMNLQDKDLGKEVSQRTTLISKVMLRINDLSFDYHNADFDVLGTAYMILIGLFASDAGKKSGEFFTPTGPSMLLARLATVGLETIRSVCDSCAGSGSLMLQCAKQIPSHKVTHYYGQEYNGSNYNLLRMNLLMHGIPYRNFTVFNDDTLIHDNFGNTKFQIQVNNPPYSLTYNPNPQLLNDERYGPCGALPPKSYADLLFVEHIAYHMDTDGRAAILLPHGVLFRGSGEQKIRKYLIDKLNCVDAIIGLPGKMFQTTSIPVVALILKRDRNGDSKNICFIDASNEFTKEGKFNVLKEDNIDKIVNAYTKRQNIDKFCSIVDIEEIRKNDYNCNIPRYVDTHEEEPEIDLAEVNKTLKDIDKQITNVDITLKSYFDDLGLDFPFEV